MKILTFKKNKDKEITDEDIESSKFNEEDIEKNFPALFKELLGEETSQISSSEAKELLSDEQEEIEIDLKIDKEFDNDNEPENDSQTVTKPMEKDYLQGFDPKAIDFIRRAKSNEEAIEVLNFLEKRGEITAKDCSNMKLQLEKEGLVSFGEHKEDGFYFEYQRKRHMEEKMKLSGKQPGK